MPKMATIIFASPRRLHLQIYCTSGTPVRRNLGIWPALPIILNYSGSRRIAPDDEDNVIAALEHPDRLCSVWLEATGSQWERMARVMYKPFPVLTYLCISTNDENAPVLPTEFFGGSTPCLQEIDLCGIPFPALPTLLLSAGDLSELYLSKIPPTGYISHEAMVEGLAALSRLKFFEIGFQSATPRPDRIRLPAVTRTVLPLSIFKFKGASEYLEDLVSRIDGPLLNHISIDYFNQLVDFQVAQLSKFINHSVADLTLFRRARVAFFNDRVSFDMYPHVCPLSLSRGPIRTAILCEGIDWQVSHMAQVLSQLSATLSNVVHLKLEAEVREGRQLKDTDDVEWLLLLHQFSAMQTLHTSQELAGHIALALEGITAGVFTEALPFLGLICLEGHPASCVEKFVASRHLSDRPVTVVDTTMEFDEILKTYEEDQEEDGSD